ncbi:MAG: TIGR02206 family membrane protein [Lactobacillales bacterium]|nr:TIGR02206 family membrane protein [Lactobacillales bacterium]
MFNYMFTYMRNIPSNVGFGQFGWIHFTVLFLEALMVAGFIKYYRGANEESRGKFRKVLASIILAMEVAKEGFLALTGQYEWGLMPLHLCGLSIFIVFFDAFWSNKASREILYSLTLPGALAALLFPDWASYPIMNVFAWQSFLIHAFLVGYVLVRLCSGEIRPNYRELWRPAVFLAIVVPIDLILNRQLGTNFFFLNTSAPGSPLEFLQTLFGNYYLLSMIGLLLIVWFFMYLPWALQEKKSKTVE